MPPSPLTITEPECPLSPLVVDSPHSGRVYPPDFAYACPLHLLRQTEDFLVDELVEGAAKAGATLIAANFPRSYIDVNRAENDIDPAVLAEAWDTPLQLTEKTAQGLGLVRRLAAANVPVYAEPLATHKVMRRIAQYYRPYHAALGRAMHQRVERFGVSYLLDCHSMPSRSQENPATDRADFILGDRNGAGCDPSFTGIVYDFLEEMGYSIAINESYKGMEIVRRHGAPKSGRHALQIEINRRLYMDEKKWGKHNGFESFQNDLTGFFIALGGHLSKMTSMPLAAE